ncbi:MAG: hypothetical protein QME45_10645 [Clostridiales bacterium]|nr:hypothetical protein [Clostridiales bacterium]
MAIQQYSSNKLETFGLCPKESSYFTAVGGPLMDKKATLPVDGKTLFK